MNSETQNNVHPVALLPMLLLAIWFICQSTASAGLNVTGPGDMNSPLPGVLTYAPAFAPVGETVLVNILPPLNSNPVIAASIEFRAANGGVVTAPLTQENPKLMSFRVPAGAITGRTALIGTNGSRRNEQPEFRVAPFGLRARGFTVVNRTQYTMGSVKDGTTELLPANVVGISPGHARFFTMTLSNSRARTIDLSLIRFPQSGGRQAVMNLREEVILPRQPGVIVSAQSRVVLSVERLTVAEVLGAVNGNSEWKIIHRGLQRSMTVSPEGLVTLVQQPQFVGQQPIISTFTLEEVSWPENAESVQFALRNNNARVGEILLLSAPFDAFSANRLGSFRNTDVPAFVPGGEPEDYVADAVPMFVRRIH
jgi:hypothetical protein